MEKWKTKEMLVMLRRRNTRENVWRIRKAELGQSRVGWLGLRGYSTCDLRHVDQQWNRVLKLKTAPYPAASGNQFE